jgi:HEAT repeat protein
MFTVLLSCALAVLTQDAPVDDKTADQALDAFKTAFKAQAEADRANAVSTLSETLHVKTLNRLVAILTSGEGPTVRTAAARGIGTFGALKKQAVASLIGSFAACAKDPAVQVAILQALGVLGDPSALPLIHRSFEEKEPQVVKAALAAAAALNNAGSIDPLIAFLARTEKSHKAKSGSGTNVALPSGNLSVNAAKPEDLLKILQEYMDGANASLQTITEQNLSASSEWQTWWTRNKPTFKPKK